MELTYIYNLKEGQPRKRRLNRHDKNHIRLITICNIAHDEPEIMAHLMSHKFKELFIFRRKKQQAIYLIRTVKERKGVKNGDNKKQVKDGARQSA